MFNKGKIEDLNAEILLLNSKIAELSKFGAMEAVKVEEEVNKLKESKANLEQELITLRNEVLEVKKSLIETQEIAMLQEVGIYQYSTILDSTVGYSDLIKNIEVKIKERNITNGGAITAAQGWTVNGSSAEAQK